MCFYVLCDDWISGDGICVDLNYEVCFLTKGLGPVCIQNFVEFSIDFRELDYFRNICLIGQVRILIFQMDCDIMMPCGFLVRFREIGTHSRTRDDCHVLTFKLGHDRNNYQIF